MSDERLREQALRYLERRDHSRAELRQKLRRKEYDAEAIEVLLDDFTERGWLNDAALADRAYAAYVRDGVYGNAYISYRLAKRGLDMPARLTADEEKDRARALVERKLVAGKSVVPARRVASFLANRGYGSAVTAAICHELAAAGLLDSDYKKNYNG